MAKSRPLFIASIILPVLIAVSAFAEAPKGGTAGLKGPVTITSETLTADSKAHTALFERDVVARTTDMTIHADTMLVFYREEGGQVTRIEAAGHVKLYKSTRLITAEKAVYYADEDKVVFTGEPRATDGDNVVTGTTMTYFIGDDRSYVEHSKVFLKSGKDRR
jgi:lipopolysaccharide export system protein LptA